MINYDGMKAEASRSAFEMLPEGAYVAKITAVKIDGETPNQNLIIRVDIAEGEHKDYFTKRYQAENTGNSRFPAKYRGDYRLRIPNPASDSKYPESDKRQMNDAIYRIESSNPGFHFDGDEKKLVGKAVGITMRLGTYNDKPFTVIGRFETVSDVKDGLCKKMAPKQPSWSPDYLAAKEQAEAAVPAGFTPVENEEIPF